jgi:hypothetical protein
MGRINPLTLIEPIGLRDDRDSFFARGVPADEQPRTRAVIPYNYLNILTNTGILDIWNGAGSES